MISTPWNWQFPPIEKSETGIFAQLGHVQCEVDETLSTYCQQEPVERMVEELMDVIHASETALRMLEANGADLNAVKRYVIEKNYIRGYYGAAYGSDEESRSHRQVQARGGRETG